MRKNINNIYEDYPQETNLLILTEEDSSMLLSGIGFIRNICWKCYVWKHKNQPVIFFWDEQSKKLQNAIQSALKAGAPVRVISTNSNRDGRDITFALQGIDLNILQLESFDWDIPDKDPDAVPEKEDWINLHKILRRGGI